MLRSTVVWQLNSIDIRACEHLVHRDDKFLIHSQSELPVIRKDGQNGRTVRTNTLA